MPEKQNKEYKSSWHDDYLKWICGFANAKGGQILIGIDDKGSVVGVADFKNLMEEIPNKMRDLMGISGEVNLRHKSGKHYIEIVVPAYSVPISLRGRYYFRSGSVKSELTGAALNEFLLRKLGKTWDDAIEPRAKLSDIDAKTIDAYLDGAAKAGRLPDYKGLTVSELLDKLRLTENKKIKRAAIILFGKDPGKFYPNTFVKIGRFGKSDTDLKFQEVEEGNLITLLPAVLAQLEHKFLIKEVSFEGMHRVEKGEYPVAAIREMILNALVHRNYMGAPIQMRIYDDKINIWNEGALPHGLTLDALKRNHSSYPRNSIIAEVCFKGGLIDSWGRGTIKILESCKAAELPEPELTERDGGFIVTLFKERFTEEQLSKMDLNDRQLQAIQYTKEHGKITNNQYQETCNTSERTASRDLAELVAKNIFIQVGKTGKGTEYILTRHKDAKGATKAPQTSQDELDKTIDQLSEELGNISPKERVIEYFNEDTFFKMYDTAIAPLMKAIIPIGQKFNKLFEETSHGVYVINDIGMEKFKDEKVENIIKKLRKQMVEKKNNLRRGNAKFNFVFHYGKLKNEGTIRVHYNVMVEMEDTEYHITAGETTLLTQIPKRKYHIALSKQEIEDIKDKMGKSIVNSIAEQMKRKGIKK